MDNKYIIGIVVLIIVIVLVLGVSIGFLIFKKSSVDIRTMLGASKLDKLIKKINKYLEKE